MLSIVVAIPVAVLAGLVAVFVLDTILPHGKEWHSIRLEFGTLLRTSRRSLDEVIN